MKFVWDQRACTNAISARFEIEITSDFFNFDSFTPDFRVYRMGAFDGFGLNTIATFAIAATLLSEGIALAPNKYDVKLATRYDHSPLFTIKNFVMKTKANIAPNGPKPPSLIGLDLCIDFGLDVRKLKLRDERLNFESSTSTSWARRLAEEIGHPR